MRNRGPAGRHNRAACLVGCSESKPKRRPKFNPRLPEGTRVYAIGDIHGRSDLLDLMHHMIGEDISAYRPPECHIIYLGDYIDRGHDSCGVLKRLSGPPPFAMKRTLLMGNHEQMLLRFLDDGSNTACGGNSGAWKRSCPTASTSTRRSRRLGSPGSAPSLPIACRRSTSSFSSP